MLDAPVSGGTHGAAATLSVIVGGLSETFAASEDLFRANAASSSGEPEFRVLFGAWRRPVGALGRRTHPRLVNEALGRHIERTSFAVSRGVDVERGLSPCRFSRQRNLVIDRLGVVGK